MSISLSSSEIFSCRFGCTLLLIGFPTRHRLTQRKILCSFPYRLSGRGAQNTKHCKYAGHRAPEGAVLNTTKSRVLNAKVCRGRVSVQVHVLVVVMDERPTCAIPINMLNVYFPNPSECRNFWCTLWNEARQKSVQPSNKSPIEISVRGISCRVNLSSPGVVSVSLDRG